MAGSLFFCFARGFVTGCDGEQQGVFVFSTSWSRLSI